MLVIKGYRWLLIDIVIALLVISFFSYQGVKLALREGLSLYSVSSSILLFVSSILLFLSQLPIFGDSVESEKLLNEKKVFTREEAKTIIGPGLLRNKISKFAMFSYLIFFTLFASLAILGYMLEI